MWQSGKSIWSCFTRPLSTRVFSDTTTMVCISPLPFQRQICTQAGSILRTVKTPGTVFALTCKPLRAPETIRIAFFLLNAANQCGHVDHVFSMPFIHDLGCILTALITMMVPFGFDCPVHNSFLSKLVFLFVILFFSLSRDLNKICQFRTAISIEGYTHFGRQISRRRNIRINFCFYSKKKGTRSEGGAKLSTDPRRSNRFLRHNAPVRWCCAVRVSA